MKCTTSYDISEAFFNPGGLVDVQWLANDASTLIYNFRLVCECMVLILKNDCTFSLDTV
jgi:hypothetical protein